MVKPLETMSFTDLAVRIYRRSSAILVGVEVQGEPERSILKALLISNSANTQAMVSCVWVRLSGIRCTGLEPRQAPLPEFSTWSL